MCGALIELWLNDALIICFSAWLSRFDASIRTQHSLIQASDLAQLVRSILACFRDQIGGMAGQIVQVRP